MRTIYRLAEDSTNCAYKTFFCGENRKQVSFTQDEARENMDLDKKEQYIFAQLQPEAQVFFTANATDTTAMAKEVAILAKLALKQLQRL